VRLHPQPCVCSDGRGDETRRLEDDVDAGDEEGDQERGAGDEEREQRAAARRDGCRPKAYAKSTPATSAAESSRIQPMSTRPLGC